MVGWLVGWLLLLLLLPYPRLIRFSAAACAAITGKLLLTPEFTLAHPLQEINKASARQRVRWGYNQLADALRGGSGDTRVKAGSLELPYTFACRRRLEGAAPLDLREEERRRRRPGSRRPPSPFRRPSCDQARTRARLLPGERDPRRHAEGSAEALAGLQVPLRALDRAQPRPQAQVKAAAGFFLSRPPSRRVSIQGGAGEGGDREVSLPLMAKK